MIPLEVAAPRSFALAISNGIDWVFWDGSIKFIILSLNFNKNMNTILQKNIINDLGLDTLPEDAQTEILTKMAEAVIKRIAVNVLEKLSEKDLEEFEKIQETAEPEAIDSFLKSKIDNYEQLVQETVKDFKEEIKETINKLKE